MRTGAKLFHVQTKTDKKAPPPIANLTPPLSVLDRYSSLPWNPAYLLRYLIWPIRWRMVPTATSSSLGLGNSTTNSTINRIIINGN